MNGAVRTGDAAKLAADAVFFVDANAAVVAARDHVVGAYLYAGRPFAMMAGNGGYYVTSLKKGEPGLRLQSRAPVPQTARRHACAAGYASAWLYFDMPVHEATSGRR